MKKYAPLAALAAALTLAPAASADTQLHQLVNRVMTQDTAVSKCQTRSCIITNLTNIQLTHAAIFNRATAIIKANPSDACFTALHGLLPAGQRASNAIVAWGAAPYTAARITAFGNAELPFVRIAWHASNAC